MTVKGPRNEGDGGDWGGGKGVLRSGLYRRSKEGALRRGGGEAPFTVKKKALFDENALKGLFGGLQKKVSKHTRKSQKIQILGPFFGHF